MVFSGREVDAEECEVAGQEEGLFETVLMYLSYLLFCYEDHVTVV